MNYHELGEGDILAAKSLISPAVNITNDERFYDIAAYHVQQAIEKELKYILHDLNDADDTTKDFRTHNIVSLCKQVEKYGISLPDDIKDIAFEISEWEAVSRYKGGVINNVSQIKSAIGVYDNLVEFVSRNLENSVMDCSCPETREPEI